MQPSVTVVIPNLNGKKFLKENLTSLINQTYPNITVVMIDNNSSDASVDFVKKEFPSVKIIQNNTNRGFVAVNQGILQYPSDYFLVLNNDTYVKPNFIEELVKEVGRNPSVGLCQPKILSSKHPDTIDAMGHLIFPDGFAIPGGRMEKDTGQYDKVEEILLPSGCAAFYKKEMLDHVGLFDEDFFAYGEDIDLGFRARLMGWNAVRVPSAVVYHYGSGTLGYISPLKAFYVERNRLWFAIKCLPTCKLLLSSFYTFYRYFAQFFGAIKGMGMAGDFLKKKSVIHILWIILKAHLTTLWNLKKLLNKRRFICKNKVVSRKQINEWFKKWRCHSKYLMKHTI